MNQDLSWLLAELRTLAVDLQDGGGTRVPIVVAIDQGGHATRALAFDLRGKLLAESFAPISTFRSGDDRVEHDAVEVSESVRTALVDLHQALGDDSVRVAAAGFATQRSSIACWDLRTNKPLGPILSWQDRRNAAFVESLREAEAEIRDRTGLVLSPHYGASKIRWYREQLDAVRNAEQRKVLAIGPLASWLLRSHLPQKPFVVDVANAARTQLLDIDQSDWSPQMLKRFGVPRDILPAVVANQHSYGDITFGERVVPLVVCTGDQCAMPFAHGAPQPDTLYLNIGTGAFVQRIDASANASDSLLTGILWRDAKNETMLRSIEGTINGAGSALDWLNERIGIDTHRAALTMNRERAARLNPPLFLNGVSGVGSPFWRAKFESRFIGEGNETERVVAVIESIAFLIGENVAKMRDGAARILVSGGFAASDYLCETVATLTGLCVERTNLAESTATGLAYLIAGQPAQWQPDARLERFTPVADPALEKRYGQWRERMAEA